MIFIMKLSKLTYLLSIYIPASSFFTQQLWNTCKTILGIKLLNLFFIISVLVVFLAIIYKKIKSGFNLRGITLICIICIGGFIFAWRQPYLPEKVHVLEFGLLGWLTIKDSTKQNRSLLKNLLLGFVFVAIVSFLTEGYQKLLPWRVFEIRDIITDILSSIFGTSLFLISRPKKQLLNFLS